LRGVQEIPQKIIPHLYYIKHDTQSKVSIAPSIPHKIIPIQYKRNFAYPTQTFSLYYIGEILHTPGKIIPILYRKKFAYPSNPTQTFSYTI